MVSFSKSGIYSSSMNVYTLPELNRCSINMIETNTYLIVTFMPIVLSALQNFSPKLMLADMLEIN